MGKKTSKKRLNTLPIKQFQPDKPKQVNIVPRNVTQESYLLKLLDPSKDIVFDGFSVTDFLIAVRWAIKMFKEKQVNKIVVTRPVVSVDEDLGFLPGTLWKKYQDHTYF